jgi:antitoxin (DNA-binding transcriptional repressor) of toxin-antitoxin stability system
MRSVSISVTEAARNFADCINRVRYQGTSFILHKNGVAVARIVPEARATDAAEPVKAGEDDEARDLKPDRDVPIREIW